LSALKLKRRRNVRHLTIPSPSATANVDETSGSKSISTKGLRTVAGWNAPVAGSHEFAVATHVAVSMPVSQRSTPFRLSWM
jgi:hypothetical protein